MKDQGKSSNIGELGKREGKSVICQWYQLSGQMKAEKRALDLATKTSLVLKQNSIKRGNNVLPQGESLFSLY